MKVIHECSEKKLYSYRVVSPEQPLSKAFASRNDSFSKRKSTEVRGEPIASPCADLFFSARQDWLVARLSAQAPQILLSMALTTFGFSPMQNTLAQEREAASAIHLPLNEFQAMHLPFGLTVAPRECETRFYRLIILLESLPRSSGVLLSRVSLLVRATHGMRNEMTAKNNSG